MPIPLRSSAPQISSLFTPPYKALVTSNRISSHGAQQGVTLIGLMVGLIISSLVVLGMFMLYRTVVHIAVDATESAKHDAELMTGMLAANIRLQGAGFHQSNASYGSSLLILKNASMTQDGHRILGDVQSDTAGPITGNGVIWSSRNLQDSGAICEALIPIAFENSTKGLAYTQADCTNLENWESLSWSSPSPIVHKGKIGISATISPCKPFGIEQGAGGIQLTLYAFNSVQLAELSSAIPEGTVPDPLSTTNIPATKNSVCLANFPSTNSNAESEV